MDKEQKFLEEYIQNKKPANYCQYCNKKIGIFTTKTIYLKFGLTYQVCKKCYKKYKK